MPPYAEAFSRARPKWKWAGAAWRGARKVAQSGGRRLHSLVTKGKRGSPVIRQVMLIYHLLRLLSDWGKGATKQAIKRVQRALMTWYYFPNSILQT